jgi:hypothetical protein
MTKRLLVPFCLVLFFLPRPVRSDPSVLWGIIDIENQTTGEIACGFVPLYIFARPDLSVGDGAGFLAVEFGVDLSQVLDAGAVYFYEESHGTVTNGSVEPGPGVQVGYGTCRTTDTHVYSVYIFWREEPSDTPLVSITPSTLVSNRLVMGDCTGYRTPHPVLGGQTIANPICPLAVQETTWGTVKALYGE